MIIHNTHNNHEDDDMNDEKVGGHHFLSAVAADASTKLFAVCTVCFFHRDLLDFTFGGDA